MVSELLFARVVVVTGVVVVVVCPELEVGVVTAGATVVTNCTTRFYISRRK